MKLTQISAMLRNAGHDHVLVTAASWRTNVSVLTTDMAKRLAGGIRAVEAGKIRVEHREISLIDGKKSGYGWKLRVSKLLPGDYFAKRLRNPGNVFPTSVLKMLEDTQKLLSVAVIDGPLSTTVHDRVGGYYDRSGKTLVIPKSVDLQTVEHELRHALDDMMGLLYSAYTKYDSQSYLDLGTDYLLNANEIRARLQGWMKHVRKYLVEFAERTQSMQQALRLEYSPGTRNRSQDADFVKSQLPKTNAAREWLRQALFSTTAATDAGLLEFVKALYVDVLRTPEGFTTGLSWLDTDDASLVQLTREPFIRYLETGEADAAFQDGFLVMKTEMHTFFADLRQEYRGLNLRQLVLHPKTGKGSRSPSRVAQEPVVEPKLPHDTNLYYRKLALERERAARDLKPARKRK